MAEVRQRFRHGSTNISLPCQNNVGRRAVSRTKAALQLIMYLLRGNRTTRWARKLSTEQNEKTLTHHASLHGQRALRTNIPIIRNERSTNYPVETLDFQSSACNGLLTRRAQPSASPPPTLSRQPSFRSNQITIKYARRRVSRAYITLFFVLNRS